MNEYRIRIRSGDAEIEVESTEKDYVDSKLKEWSQRLGLGVTGVIAHKVAAPTLKLAAKGKSLAEHVRDLAPKSGSQYVIAVGDYFERYGKMGDGFKIRDIIDAFRAVKYRHSNPSEAVRQAKQQGFLMDGKESGSLLLTQTAESWIKGQTAGEEGGENGR